MTTIRRMRHVIPMRSSFALVLLALSLSCAPEATAIRVPGPSGREAFDLECRNGRTSCYQRAAQICPSGYDIVDSASHARSVVATHISSDDELLIQCKASHAETGHSLSCLTEADGGKTCTVEE